MLFIHANLMPTFTQVVLCCKSAQLQFVDVTKMTIVNTCNTLQCAMSFLQICNQTNLVPIYGYVYVYVYINTVNDH